jgi:hypothetical protein
MRGTIYYQTSQLVKCIFFHNAKKGEKVDPSSNAYQHVSSFKTMETYRRIWNNLGLFIKDEYAIKDLEQIEACHIESYMLSKSEKRISKQYLEKISSALGKLEIALTKFSHTISKKEKSYDFSIRESLIDQLRKTTLVYDGYHNRAYEDPLAIISLMQKEEHQLAARIQLCSGTRFEGIGLIHPKQCIGETVDQVTQQKVFAVETKEKGGKIGAIHLGGALYNELMLHLMLYPKFKVHYQSYINDIRQACQQLYIPSEGSHGFRWCYAQNRIRESQQHGMTYEQALLQVSHEMKHNRISISEHYLG